MRLRKDIVFERLLARLLVAAPERWILKGGLALDYRLGDRARTTKDLDLGRQDDAEAATVDLMVAAGLDLGDYFHYAIEQTDALAGLEDAAAVRYRVRAELAGRVFEHVVVDVGFDAPRLYVADLVRGRGLLSFAGLESPAVPTIPLTYHVAEKVHAYTRQYGASGRQSTRVKDLIDLVLIAAEKTISTMIADTLRVALEQTFSQRSTQVLPAALPVPPTAWTLPYRRIAQEVGLTGEIMVGYTSAAAFLNPVLARTCTVGAVWQPQIGKWTSAR